MFVELSVLTLTVLFAGVFYYLFVGYDYFEKQNIPGPKPYPFFGTMWKLWESVIDKELEWYRKFGRIYGTFDGRTPNYVISDPEILRNILVKDFDCFRNRRRFPASTTLIRHMLSVIRDEKWREVRMALTPVFTTGKIKKMSLLIQQCSDRLVERIKHDLDKGEIDARNVFGSFTMDVIATCAFGLKIESLNDPENKFLKYADAIFRPKVANSPIATLPFAAPWMLKLLRVRTFPKEMIEFYQEIMMEVFDERRSTEQKHNDFVDLMLDSMEKQGEDSVLTDEVVVAQAVLFLLAGFETTATTLAMMAYYLAKNPHVQERLVAEIQETQDKNGEITHDILHEMPYLDQCLSETLRIAGPTIRIERLCEKDVQYGDLNIEAETIVSVPVYAMHHDPEFYPEPEVFNPDRFSHENKVSRNPYTYLPFGEGPRNCIGMRFAQEEIKLALCNVLQQIKFVVVEKTPETPEFLKGFTNLLQPVNVIVGIEERH